MPLPCPCTQTTTPCLETPCVEKKCDCPVLLKTDCTTNVTVSLPYTGILKGKTLNEWMLALDAFLNVKFTALQSYFKLSNVGVGAGKIYKGINIFGEKEIKSILGSNLINITNLTDEVAVAVNETALTTFVNGLIPTTSTTAVNVGTGLGLIFRDKVSNVLNFRKIKTENLGTGASVLKTESTVLDDVVISAKSLKSSNGSVTITETLTDIDFLVTSSIPDGSETKVIAGTNTTVTGVGTIANPYIVNSIPNGSETKVVAGTNVLVTGLGTITNPYIINATATVASTQMSNGLTTNVSGNGTALTPFVIETTNPQKEITANYTLSNSDNNYVLFINTTTDITITIPTGLIVNFQCGFIQETAFETTFIANSGVILNTPIGFRIRGQKYNAFLEKKQSTETYYLLGNTKV
jgi:spore maturation protein SpmA